nr:helix-turn-helix transcriptional regulator [Lactiplantibacillus plantarum]
MELGQALKLQREALGLTQQVLADQLHVTRQTVSRWENGSTYPNLDTLVELSDRLQISLDKLLKSDEVPVAPVVHQISRDVQLKQRYLRGLIVTVSLIVLLGGLIVLLSWGIVIKLQLLTALIHF